MIALDPPFRIATEHDAPELAELVHFASGGLARFFWEDIAAEGEDPWQVGRARQAEKAREGQIVVADFGDGAVACLTGYTIGPEPKPVGDDMHPVVRPLQELENEAPDSWYVNVLACYPAHRGQGLGGQLLELADRIGRAEGLSRMSLIVAADNAGARRLYERHGYRETASRPCVTQGWQTNTERWVLMLKSL